MWSHSRTPNYCRPIDKKGRGNSHCNNARTTSKDARAADYLRLSVCGLSFFFLEHAGELRIIALIEEKRSPT